MNRHLLVIGYGNELRHDDAVGPQTARAAERLNIPGLEAIAVQQLTPELAETMADAECVIFVDAGRHGVGAVACRPLTPLTMPSSLGHAGDPRELLALTDALFGCRPRAWLITVPAPDLSFGEGLSATAALGMVTALQEITRIARDVSPTTAEAGRCTKSA